MFYFLNLPIPLLSIYRTSLESPQDDTSLSSLKKGLISRIVTLCERLYSMNWQCVALSSTFSLHYFENPNFPHPGDLAAAHEKSNRKVKSHSIMDHYLRKYSAFFLQFIKEVQEAVRKHKNHFFAKNFRILSRIDMETSVPQWNKLGPYITDTVDLLALRVTDDSHLGMFIDKAPNMYDVVVLDSIHSAPFVKTRLKQMVRLQIPLEVSYGEAMHNDVEFVQFIGRMRMILKFTDLRRNVVFSHSYHEIETYLDQGEENYPALLKFFSPSDVATIATLYGYRYSIGLRCLSEHATLLLNRSQARRGFKGVAEVIELNEEEASRKRKLSEYISKKTLKRKRRKKKAKSSATK